MTKLFNRGTYFSQLEVIVRHGPTRFARYLTPRKLVNMARTYYEHQRGIVKPKGRPFVLRLENTNICTLRCPGCPTGTQTNAVRPGTMPLESFKAIIDSVADHLVLARMDGIGEPTLNPHIWDQIQYAHERGIGTAMSSHLGSVPDDKIHNFVDSGLDYLICSIDGATQEIYELYRKRGNLERSLETARSILRYRQQRGVKHPFVEVQFIKFAHNAHQEEEVRALAQSMGADRFTVKRDHGDVEEALRSNSARGEEDLKEATKKICYWPWYVLTINWNSALNMCCFALPMNLGMDAYDPKDFYASWHHPKLVKTRAVLAHKLLPQDLAPDEWRPPCLECTHYGFVEPRPLAAASE